MQDLRTEAELEALLADAGQPILLFKHSTTCPISAAAHTALLAAHAAGELAGVRLARVRVIEERPLSQAIAARLGVPHASPQALLVAQGRVLWHASHWAITREALRTAVQAAARA